VHYLAGKTAAWINDFLHKRSRGLIMKHQTFLDVQAGSGNLQQGLSQQVEFNWGVKIPMRDGVQLNATLYRPKNSQPTPAICTLTPYIADGAHPRGLYFASHGYTFVAVDSRGRGNSEGIFEPFANEAQDGYDIVEWLAKQTWCDSQVAMWGGSYGGYDQWVTLREAPPHLKTIVPTASAHAGVDFPFLKNIFSPFEMQWLTYVSGAARNLTIMNDAKFWVAKFQELYQGHLPYNELDKIVGNQSTYFQTWISHPQPDEYWDKMSFPPEAYDQISIPILTITGHYDDDQPGAMEYYRNHMMSKSAARESHYLIIGPWDHSGTRDPKTEFGGLQFSSSAILDMNEIHLEWYDWTMKAGMKPPFLEKRVAYYVMGEEKWKYADRLEEIGAKPKRFFLCSHGEAKDVFHSGTLEEEPGKGADFDTFIYDPMDTRPGDLEWEPIDNYLTDQTSDLNLFGNGVVYHSEPLTEYMEITGWVRFFAWIAMDVPDTDFKVSLSEVQPDGRLIRLTQDLLRARYRESERQEKLINSGEINRFIFEGFTFFSRRISKGSRLRLILSCPNTIYLEKNFNSGGVVAGESGKDARTAHITLYHDQDHPTYVELPVVSCN
jgi:putative CocE/NonD family hydrolase